MFKDLKIYFTNKVLEKKISIEYQKLKTLNKSSLVRETIIDTDIVIINIFLPLISIFSEIIIIIPALILLFLLNFYVLVAIIFFLIIAYIIYNFFFKKKIINIGSIKNKEEHFRQNYANIFYSSIPQILINNSFSDYAEKIRNKTYVSGESDRLINFYQLSPKHFIEFFILTLFCILFLLFNNFDTNYSNLTFLLGMYVVAILRLMPSINRSINAIQQLRYGSDFLKKLKSTIFLNSNNTLVDSKTKEEVVGDNIFNLNRIKLDDVSFAYDGKKY